MKIRVGIDARLLSEQVTGIGRYTAELTKELVKQDGTFFLYSPKNIDVGDWKLPNVTLRAASFKSRVGKMCWSQSYLPYWASIDRVDVFWGATHRLPYLLPASVARVVTIHDLVWKHSGESMRPVSRWLENRLMPAAVRLADRVVADSNSTAMDLKVEFPSVVSKIRTVYPGVTVFPSLAQRPEYLVSIGVVQPYFLFVGTLEPRKNLHRLLRAYAGLDDASRQRCKMVIAGGKGWGSFDVHSFISDVGLKDSVVVIGYVSDAELATLYENAQFLAMPSLYEGFGLPIVEAMSYGIPVLTSQTSSMPEVAGDAGVLVDPFDEMLISAGLSSLLNNECYRNELASRATSNARRFSWQNAAKKMWAVFEEARYFRDSELENHC